MTDLDIHASVIGKVWQGYREPLNEFAAILAPDRLTVVDRYVADEEACVSSPPQTPRPCQDFERVCR